MSLDELRRELLDARAALLEAMSVLTERDFAQEVEGATITQWLAQVAPAERDAVRRSRSALGLPERPLPPRRESGRVLPPQVVHDLAGSRHEMLLLLDAIEALDSTEALSAKDGDDSIANLLHDVAQRDLELARLVATRPSRSG